MENNKWGHSNHKHDRLESNKAFLVKARKVGGGFKGRGNGRPLMRALHEEPGNAEKNPDERVFPLPANGAALTEREPISMAAS